MEHGESDTGSRPSTGPLEGPADVVLPPVSNTGSGGGSDPMAWRQWVGAQSTAPLLTVGSVIRGRFALEELLGTGGMGVVFRALDLRRQEAQDRHPYVAIKVLGEQFRLHPDALIALHREATKTQKLAHPLIANVYDFDRDGGNAFIVMELLEGEALSQAIKRHENQGLPREKAFHVIAEVGLALSHAHSKGVIHSDLKPSNVYLTRQGGTKVIDFGVARAARRFQPGAETVQTVFDAARLGAASLSYASPEQLLAIAEPDPRDDVYAMGVVAFETLAGRHPFDRRSALEAKLEDLPVPLIAGVTAQQNEALRRALHFNREHRTRTIEEFIRQLGIPVAGGASLAPSAQQDAGRTRLAQAFVTPWLNRRRVENPLPVQHRATARSSIASRAVLVGVITALGLGAVYYTRAAGQRQRDEQAQATRESQEAERLQMEAQAERDRTAKALAKEQMQQSEARIAEERLAREKAEDLARRAEQAALAERSAREQAERESVAAKRAAARKESEPKPSTPGAVATSTSGDKSIKPGMVYRWHDASGGIHYGTEVPPEYAAQAVPLMPSE